MTKFFFKANDDVLSHCRCEGAPAMSEGQLDCPWCGCGWMISCSRCGKSFTFAEVRETDIPLRELGRREADTRGLKDITDKQVADWAESMAETLDYFEVGDIVVYLDGLYWRMDETVIAFKGFYAAHDLERLPHVEALSDPGHLRRVLGDPNYWFDRELPDRDPNR
ncbi:MAG TPA: hypothetical protein VLK25_11335 [Allosphingosinicella sp.]|nr:hypothetical protein [Allosphingosinicella sp.]